MARAAEPLSLHPLTSAEQELISTHPALSEHDRQEAGRMLNAQLIELTDLHLIAKQLHWDVVGSDFRQLHLFLDDLVDAWRELADKVAEHGAAVGVFADARASTVAEQSPFEELPDPPYRDIAVVELLTQRLKLAVARAHERMHRLDEIDPSSQDVIIEVVRKLEEGLWMMRVQEVRSRPNGSR